MTGAVCPVCGEDLSDSVDSAELAAVDALDLGLGAQEALGAAASGGRPLSRKSRRAAAIRPD